MDRIRALLADLRARLADLQTWFQRLTPRERRLVAIASSAFGAFVLFSVLISFSTSAAGYRRRTEEKLNKLKEVQTLAASYREAEQTRQTMERQLTTNKLSLMSYLEEKATGSGVSIPSMNQKPDASIADGKIVESSVDITLQDITVNRMVEFLSAVERGPGVVKVKNLRVEPRTKEQTLTVWATVATYRLKQ
ncbi:MAG TPA: type II secretion system protein GspM [Myxococcaceae bacterium]|nr:type II secretion system protein GspM [Myxococcaceae bacterium]